jgi:glutathione S-transferase
VRSVANVLQLAQDLEAHLNSHGPWLLGEQFTLAEIAWSPFLARLEALEMLEVFFDGRPAAGAWWGACKSRDSFSAADVGPAPGGEAENFARCGRHVRRELEALTERIGASSIYALTSRTSRDR